MKRPIRSFEADKDVDDMLKMAQEDGLTITEICNRALKFHGLKVIREILSEHRQRHKRWETPQIATSEIDAMKKATEGSSAAIHLAQESGRKHKAESPNENKRRRASGGQ